MLFKFFYSRNELVYTTDFKEIYFFKLYDMEIGKHKGFFFFYNDDIQNIDN